MREETLEKMGSYEEVTNKKTGEVICAVTLADRLNKEHPIETDMFDLDLDITARQRNRFLKDWTRSTRKSGC